MADCSTCDGTGEICMNCDEASTSCECGSPDLEECQDCLGSGQDPDDEDEDEDDDDGAEDEVEEEEDKDEDEKEY